MDIESTKRAFRAELKTNLRAFLVSDDRLTFKPVASPKVSILLVLWNQGELTLACLKAIATYVTLPIELVIIDNASSDDTGLLLDRIDGAIIMRNEDNIGFLLAVNQAAGLASGDLVLLLNNDAMIRPGALEAAVKTLESDPSIGAVGGPIVLVDGTLQEAGSIIWRDGTCLGYGRGRNPEDPEFRFQRDVDYCSGAFLLIRRHVWAKLGGFSTDFAPAYYEETDLCMRVRAEGLRVVYEPNATVDHFEFGSAGPSDWAIQQQLKNQSIFVERNRDALHSHFDANPANPVLARSRRPAAGRILVIDEMVPHEIHGAGYPRAAKIVRVLQDHGYQITFYPLLFPQDNWDEVYKTFPPQVETMLGFGVDVLEAFLTERKGMYNSILISRPTNMVIFDDLMRKNTALAGDARIIYDAEAVFAAREVLRRRLIGEPMGDEDAQQLLDKELGLTQSAHHIVAVANAEADYFRQFGRKDISILSHLIVPRPTASDWVDRKDLLFVGRVDGEGSPNVDSLIWFVGQILPLILVYDPSIRLLVVGKNDAPSIQAMRSKSVELLGTVDDLTDIYDRARVFVAPTRFAAGIPHKIHEAAAYGIPVVATPILAKQLGWRDNGALLVGDTPEAFAAAVLKLYDDRDLWNAVRNAAIKAIEIDCNADQFKRTLIQAVAAG